ncbi:FecR domain-containing protein [Stratiformator vulcanicus]|uniref:FecR protein n=1 Tax=Stratiformator vulcanicus TaxID=2527980 RepID=A0A517R0X4_9PLAN|nr:FecR domain-containing protein [Stratiformator vulcanicus]QDT37552.1 FecR protein [Stratiformator vulcanicus]
MNAATAEYDSAQNELLMLANSACSGQMSQEGAARLEELLTDNLSLQQRYVEFLDIHSQLRALAHADHVADQISSALQQPARIRKPRLRRSRTWYIAIASVAVPVAILITTACFMVSQIDHRAIVLDRSREVEWGSASVSTGERINPGREFEIVKGFVELEFHRGTRAILRGPGRYRMEGARELSILSGSALCRVPAPAVGFTVRTPDGRIVDLGTEFLTEVHPDAGTTLLVRAGKAEIGFNSPGGTEGWSMLVQEGESARCVIAEKTVSAVPYSTDRFHWYAERTRAVKATTGAVRFVETPTGNPYDGRFTSGDEAVVIPERLGVTLEDDLLISTSNGETVIPAGTKVDSYLVTCHPGETAASVSATIQFRWPLLAILYQADALDRTDDLFAVPYLQQSRIPQPGKADRGAEELEDTIADIDFASGLVPFSLQVPPQGVDQFRVLMAGRGASLDSN